MHGFTEQKHRLTQRLYIVQGIAVEHISIWQAVS